MDGTIRIDPLVERLKETGMNACALTDHGVMYGSYKFYTAMKYAGLKPILGCEIYVAPRSMADKESGIDNKYFHMVLLAKNLEGYKNLMKVVSAGHMHGFYYKPRVDIETLSKHSGGLIATSACLGGVVAKYLLKDDFDSAKEAAKKFGDIYKDNFYIEIQRNGIEEQDTVNPQLLQIAEQLDLPIVATCDAHYLQKEDAMIQEILWCIADGKTLDDESRRQMGTQELYVKTPEEMSELFSDLPEAIENTQKIADQIEEYSPEFERVEPEYSFLENGESAGEMLRRLTYEGAEKKYGEVTEELKERLDFELEVIDGKGYNDYFLVTRMFVKFCRDNGIVVGMRGSGCGSAVAYCTDITHIEPIGWELYFERFLNPERDSPPDFDIDIADRRRHEVIDFATEIFGEESVKQIGTFSKLQTRQAIRDVSRVLGIDLGVADQLSKMVEIVFGKAKDIDYMIENNPEFAEVVNGSPEMEQMADIVRKVSGMCRGVSTHACGVVITPTPVSDYVPIQRDSKNEGLGMTQFEMGDLEYVGLMKFDFLGLRNLGVIGDAVDKIEESSGERLDLLDMDEQDDKAFDLIRSANTVGVFQLESEGMRKTIRMLKPTNLEEVCYLVAAYRPGPMQFIPEYVEVKEGKKEVEYLIPDLEPILKVTNGVITYQEQVIRVAVDIAGYTMGAADKLRKAMSKKKMDVMEAEKPKFMAGSQEKGYELADMEALWDRLLQFANYGFNKAHSASYAQVAYWTAYLKANHPLEFMAALLEGDLDDFERVVLDLKECERMGIKVLPPSVNESTHKFNIAGESSIRFGMAAIKNVGEDIVQKIVIERNQSGKFKNLDDFIFRMIPQGLQKRVVEYLIMAGCMDEWGDRAQLLSLVESLHGKYKKTHEDNARGQLDLFGGGELITTIKSATSLPDDISESTVHQRLDWEKELLGIYLSSHPLDDLMEFFHRKDVVPISSLSIEEYGKKILTIGGIVSTIKRITTKKGDSMAFIEVQDKTGRVDMVVFPRTYEELREELEPNKPTLFAGRLNDRDGEMSFILEKAKVIDPDKFASNFTGVTLKINGVHSLDEVEELKQFIKDNPGNTEVRVILTDGIREKCINLSSKVQSDLPQFEKYMERFS